MEQQYDDTFLARWLANELTAEELQEFENSEDFEKYAQIVDTLETAELPEFDLEANFQATLDKLSTEKKATPKKKVIPIWRIAAAASVLVFVVLYTYLNYTTETTWYANLAEKRRFELPDGSQVHLNASSKLTYKGPDWEDNREVQLKGEAYFKVQKGSTFTVNTELGNVSVLGTQFTVESRTDLYKVVCFEGKVLVVNQKQDSIYLTKGMAYLQQKDRSSKYNLTDVEPSWINNESSFKETPINMVLDDLERQFGISITGRENLDDVSFTGRFSHEDANLALQTVFLAMEIEYTTSANGDVVILKP